MAPSFEKARARARARASKSEQELNSTVGYSQRLIQDNELEFVFVVGGLRLGKEEEAVLSTLKCVCVAVP